MPVDRLPPIPDEQMTPVQREAVREIAAGPRGALIGPFIPALRSPEFMRRLQRLGEYLRYGSAIELRLREMAILMVARQWSQPFEWDVHEPLAISAGLSPHIAAAIAEGRRPDHMQPDEALLFDFCTEIQRSQTVSDATYAAAVAMWGEQAVVDLVGGIGYYAMLALLMNVAGTPVTSGRPSTLPTLPR